MVEALPAVALLFDDVELGGYLRQALQECGAHIVHEGTVADFDAVSLRQFDPDVLVVNLDEDDDASFDRLFSMLGGARPRLVLNDARASRALTGWDRARWARHLVVKVLAGGDVDPPRPADALAVETVPAVAIPPSEPVAAFAPEPAPGMPATAQPEVLDMPLSGGDPDRTDERAAAQARAESEDLEVRLAALLAAPVPPAVEPVISPDLANQSATHDFTASDDLETELAALLASGYPLQPEGEPVPFVPRLERPLHDGDFSLAPPVDDKHSAAPAAMPAPAATPRAPAVPDGWALVDHDAAAVVRAGEAEGLGVQKMDAADFPAPDVEPAAPGFKPTLSLELVSLEETVTPQAREPNEMLLDDLGNTLTRVILLGAAIDGLDSVCEFLASLPASARHTILLTQHFGVQSAESVLQRLSGRSSLPVRLAMQGSSARLGEVLLVPPTGQVQLRRDGRVELREHGEDREPSIDASFGMAANAFGRAALGIVFAGHSTDAAAGAQAIHDRGGQVWVEAANGEHYPNMLGDIFARRLVSHSGTPRELAAHLTEVYP